MRFALAFLLLCAPPLARADEPSVAAAPPLAEIPYGLRPDTPPPPTMDPSVLAERVHKARRAGGTLVATGSVIGLGGLFVGAAIAHPGPDASCQECMGDALVGAGVDLLCFSTGTLTALIGAAVLGHAHALEHREERLARRAARR